MHVNPFPKHIVPAHSLFRLEWPGKTQYYLGYVQVHLGMSLKDSFLNEVIANKILSPVGNCAIIMDPSYTVREIGLLAFEVNAKSKLERVLFNNRLDPHCLNNLEHNPTLNMVTN